VWVRGLLRPTLAELMLVAVFVAIFLGSELRFYRQFQGLPNKSPDFKLMFLFGNSVIISLLLACELYVVKRAFYFFLQHSRQLRLMRFRRSGRRALKPTTLVAKSA
jgi:hypothetical protein